MSVTEARSADVVIVGGGVAGLACAAALCAAGADVHCLEARARVGGRTLSAAGWADLGATWYWEGERAVAQLVDALGLVRYPQALAGDALFEQPDGAVARLDGNPLDVPAWRLEGGMQALSLALARSLPEGVIATGSPVRAVRPAPGGLLAVETPREMVAGRVVVLAVPPRLAVETLHVEPSLPRALHEAARGTSTWMGDMVKAVAVYDEPFWRRDGLAGAAISYVGPFGELHDHSGSGPGHAAVFGFAPSARLAGVPLARIAELYVEQLARLFGPAAREATAVHAVDWSREPFTATAGPQAPGSVGYGAPALRAPYLDGRLLLASTETASAFGGHVEGAILAGRRAAGQALGLL